MNAIAPISPVGVDHGIHFASEPVMIGANMWRVVVLDSKFGGRRFAYQYHPIGEMPIWEDQKRWPAFDMYRSDRGLPAALARLYLANKSAIDLAIRNPHLSYSDVSDFLLTFR